MFVSTDFGLLLSVFVISAILKAVDKFIEAFRATKGMDVAISIWMNGFVYSDLSNIECALLTALSFDVRACCLWFSTIHDANQYCTRWSQLAHSLKPPGQQIVLKDDNFNVCGLRTCPYQKNVLSRTWQPDFRLPSKFHRFRNPTLLLATIRFYEFTKTIIVTRTNFEVPMRWQQLSPLRRLLPTASLQLAASAQGPVSIDGHSYKWRHSDGEFDTDTARTGSNMTVRQQMRCKDAQPWPLATSMLISARSDGE
uniref:Secreted protein n=1 Tax=Panagrellus redivivus TaxID=6233 RepID=A0A7E4W7U2_PANRE